MYLLVLARLFICNAFALSVCNSGEMYLHVVESLFICNSFALAVHLQCICVIVASGQEYIAPIFPSILSTSQMAKWLVRQTPDSMIDSSIPRPTKQVFFAFFAFFCCCMSSQGGHMGQRDVQKADLLHEQLLLAVHW